MCLPAQTLEPEEREFVVKNDISLGDDPQRRADRAEALVQMGELSAGRHALEGAPIAPGTEATLKAFQDPLKRPPTPRDPAS